jgi:hypothetical protein
MLTGCNVSLAPDAHDVARVLAELLYRRDLALELGRAHIRYGETAVEAELEPLTLALLENAGITLDEVMLLPVGDLIRAVAGEVRADFRADRTVALEGWLLSVSEARICAIARLLDRPEAA